MHIFQGLLLNLFALLTSTTTTDDVRGTPVPESPCRARAWVRAPDLAPGEVIQGDVKVKLDGSCDEVTSYSLKLRFVERSWVKTRRQDSSLPKPPTQAGSLSRLGSFGESVLEADTFGFRFGSHYGANSSAWNQYEREMMDPGLWLIREEERIGFEIVYPLRKGKQLGHDVVDSFAIVVPSTNYPPSFDSGADSIDQMDAADSEHVYSYSVDINFINGTQTQVQAGYTSFNAIRASKPQPVIAETIEVAAQREKYHEDCRCFREDKSGDQFTLEVTFPIGGYFEPGSKNNITVISHQLGPGIQRPAGLSFVNINVSQKRRWAASFAADDDAAKRILRVGSMRSSQLFPSINDTYQWSRHTSDIDSLYSRPRFSQDGVVENGTGFSTEAIIAQFIVPQDCYPPFEMYYQTSEVELVLNLEVKNISTAAIPQIGKAVNDELYDWTPLLSQEQREHMPSVEFLRTRIPVFVGQRQEDRAASMVVDLTHYLSSLARAPTFVNPSSVHKLRQKTVEERDALAPLAKPLFIARTDGDVVKHRYLESRAYRGSPNGPYYVGDTWLRKVLSKGDGEKSAAKSAGLVIQG